METLKQKSPNFGNYMVVVKEAKTSLGFGQAETCSETINKCQNLLCKCHPVIRPSFSSKKKLTISSSLYRTKEKLHSNLNGAIMEVCAHWGQTWNKCSHHPSLIRKFNTGKKVTNRTKNVVTIDPL